MFVLTADAHITYVGGSVTPLLGHAPEEITGASLLDYVHPDDLASAESGFAEVRAESDQLVMREIRLRHGNGSWLLFQGTARNRLSDPPINGIVLNCHDVTDERIAQNQLRQAQKMEAVGRLAGGIAHDFNNLLTSIIGYAELSLDEMKDDSMREDIQAILKAGNVASSLTRQLLAFSRQQVLRPEIISPGEVVEDSIGMLRRLIGPGIELKTRTAPDLGTVLVDTGQLHQVLLNLVVNARDAIDGDGTITIETANARLSEEYVQKGHAVVAGQYVLLSVRDTGQGMSPEVRERVFEPFYTTKEQGKGTGLGLSTTYGIVKQSGGYIWVYSEPGHGTIFKVYLPRVADSSAQVVIPEEKPAVAAGQTILVVEDEDSVRTYATKVLTRAGYKVIEASGGAEALMILGDRASEIRLILTDMIMPKMSGTVMSRTVREHYPGIRLLFTSGYPREEMSANGRLPANVAFVEKPYTPVQLLDAVGGVMGGM